MSVSAFYGPWRRDCDGDDVVVDVDDVDGQHQHCAGNGPWRADKDDPSNLWSGQSGESGVVGTWW